ncbi:MULTISPECIES: vWA domain-containing protein [unclassified Nitrospina]|uniref:vWA domain-containing protein n=1 Tax=unclassified Nitrospina TaxID=2638683 RepID=UPI003F94335C
MTYFQFANPWLFLLLLAIPWMVYQHYRNRPAAFPFSSLNTLRRILPSHVSFLVQLPLILRCLAVILIVIALARPQEGRKSTEILTHGVDIMLALDTSASMQAMDFKKKDQPVDRLTIVKDVVSEFIDGREFDRMGMVVFGNEAFTQCPLTLDHNILQEFLSRLDIGVAGDSTAIGSAIAIAVKRLKDLESKSKVIILLTDGRNNAGSIPPRQAAEIAATFGIKIYTVGVGTRGKVPFVFDGILGRQMIMQDVEMDEESLKEIADTTNGKYFRAMDTDSLKKIYAQIDQLEKSEVKWIDHSEFKELFPYFLIPGLLLLITEITLAQTRLRRIP